MVVTSETDVCIIGIERGDCAKHLVLATMANADANSKKPLILKKLVKQRILYVLCSELQTTIAGGLLDRAEQRSDYTIVTAEIVPKADLLWNFF
jgi:hypothetical protein